ncbi:MAG: DUF3048 domain-containing protein [Firmicutes bacterium]|nr:DUF3048 domain-containing protein [Bacillota bacterium]
MKNSKIVAALVLAAALACAGGAFLLTACSGSNEEAAAPPPEPEPITNPLTGATAEQGYDENAINQRIVAVVVENSPDARPQWGMDDEEYSPDIILEGEVEGGITRTLWFFSDYNKMPEQVGPLRSARPPFIRFSECFDSIFIHWGMSHSKGLYVGASTVFKDDNIDHINQMSFANECGLFDRDSSRGVSMEHTGILYGDKVPAAIEEYGCRTEPKIPTKLNFNETAELMSNIQADEIRLQFSKQTNWETKVWTYNEEDQQYHTDAFKNDLKRDNLLVLFDDTEYITKDNYEGPGSTGSVTYCDYALGGGEGKLFSQGTVKNIEWKIKKHKLYLIDADATEAAKAEAEAAATDEGKTQEEIDAAVKAAVVYANLNPGKTWIGWASDNNGGELEIIPNEPMEEPADDAEGADGTEDGGETTETEAAE